MADRSEQQLREDIVEVGRRLYARGYTASNDGNISLRLDASRLLMTPTSVCKGFMTVEMMCITDLDGKKIAGDRNPSSEMQMHLEVYRQRPEIQAVVHAHPPIATGFAVAGIPLDRAVLAEVVTTLGSVPIAEYATPSTKELPEAVRKYVKAHDGHAARQPRRADARRRRLRARTTRWRRSSTSPRSAWSRGCSAASACSRAPKSRGSRSCAGRMA